MTPRKKQLVVFIALKRWGGGVERVLYELAHGLDRHRFTVKVIFLEEGKSNPIPYDSSVSTICLESAEKNSAGARPHCVADGVNFAYASKTDGNWRILRSMITHSLRNIYHIIPLPVRARLKVGEKIKQIRQGTKKYLARTGDKGEFPIVPNYTVLNGICENWLLVLQMREALKKIPQDAIMIPMDERNTVILWLSQVLPYRKVIASQHYPYSQAQALRYPELEVRRAKEWLYLNACRSAEIVTFDSEGSRLDFIKNYGASAKRTLFMANPIPCNSIIRKSKMPLPDNLKQLNRKTIFVQVARLVKEKNPLLLVAACSLLRRKYDDFVVFCVGNGPLFGSMQDEIKRMYLQDHILLLGEQANPYPYMSNSRALLLTSMAESSPLVLLESLVCGVVPVATDCVAGPRELLGNGKYGLLVPPNDAHLFAHAMYQLATDNSLYDRLRKNASEWVLRFDSPRALKEWEKLIETVGENRES